MLLRMATDLKNEKKNKKKLKLNESTISDGRASIMSIQRNGIKNSQKSLLY